MPAVFNYAARNADGRFVAGAISAETPEQALAHLRTRALFITALEKAGSSRGIVASVFTMLPVNASARLAFFRSLATLLHSGVALRRALEVTIEECRDSRLAEGLRSIASDIEAGVPLSSAMGRRPREFSPLFIAFVRAGEVSGTLDRVLERLAQFLERDRALRKRVKAALAYPAIVAFAALALVLFLIANTVPAFASMFTEMHVRLPLSTKILLAVGQALTVPSVWIVLLAIPAGAPLGALAIRRSEAAQSMLDALRLHAPVFGPIVRKATVGSYARTLGTLLQSGVTLMTALDASRDVVESIVYRKCLGALPDALREGDPLAVPLEKSLLFDPLFLQLVRVGEETGALDSMLLRLAEYYELDVETAITTLGSVLEPILILLLGTVVGTIVASILIPLYSIIGSIK